MKWKISSSLSPLFKDKAMTTKTLPGNQALYGGTLHCCRLTLAAGTLTRLTDATNPQAGAVKQIEVTLTQGEEYCSDLTGDTVSDGSANGYHVVARHHPEILPAGVTGTWDPGGALYNLSSAATRTATNVPLILSQIQGMLGTTIAAWLDSVPLANAVAWRWEATGDMAVQPVAASAGTYATWPTIEAGASGLWDADTLRTLSVRNLGSTSGYLHLMLVNTGRAQ